MVGSTSAFSFGNAGDEDDDFGDFQGVGLEIVMSTRPDGTVVGAVVPEDDPFAPPSMTTLQNLSTSSYGGSTEPSPISEEGEATPKASKVFFDDTFGSSPPRSPTRTTATTTSAPEEPSSTGSSSVLMADVDQDFFSFSRSRPSPVEDDAEGANSSNVSNALSLLERSFGKVSVSEEDHHALNSPSSEATASPIVPSAPAKTDASPGAQ